MCTSDVFSSVATRPPEGMTEPGSTTRYSMRPATGARSTRSSSATFKRLIWASASARAAVASPMAARATWTPACSPSRWAVRRSTSAPETSASCLSRVAWSSSSCAMRACTLRTSVSAPARCMAWEARSRAASTAARWASRSVGSCRAMTSPALTRSPSRTGSSMTRPGYLAATSMRSTSTRPLPRWMPSGRRSRWVFTHQATPTAAARVAAIKVRFRVRRFMVQGAPAPRAGPAARWRSGQGVGRCARA